MNTQIHCVIHTPTNEQTNQQTRQIAIPPGGLIILIISIYKVHNVSGAESEVLAVTRWVEIALRAIG